MKLLYSSPSLWTERVTQTFVVGRVIREGPNHGTRDEVLLTSSLESARSAVGYGGMITSSTPSEDDLLQIGIDGPIFYSVANSELIESDWIIAAYRGGRTFRVVYRPGSLYNVLFATARCNSNCIMCSQPPVDKDDSLQVDLNMRIIELLQQPPPMFGVSGGEPTLLGEDLFRLLRKLKQKFPSTPVHMLTNGRRFFELSFAAEFREASPDGLSLGIPLYSAFQDVHDFIVQSRGAFDQTVIGLHNLARVRVPCEIRVVLLKQNIPGLKNLCEYIYRNLPFVAHVALMGLEPKGYALKNMGHIWIDPVDFAEELVEAVRYLNARGFRVSIYNLPLCVVDQRIRDFARQSISDYKNVFLDKCSGCALRSDCAGFFQLGPKFHSRGISPVSSGAVPSFS